MRKWIASKYSFIVTSRTDLSCTCTNPLIVALEEILQIFKLQGLMKESYSIKSYFMIRSVIKLWDFNFLTIKYDIVMDFLFQLDFTF